MALVGCEEYTQFLNYLKDESNQVGALIMGYARENRKKIRRWLSVRETNVCGSNETRKLNGEF